jgi:hypothetical protein
MRRRVAAWLVSGPFKALFWALVVLLPLLGAWIGSSLAAYRNGPVWVPIVCAAVAFPVLPVAWDVLGEWRRRRGTTRSDKAGKGAAPPARRFLTMGDRLILRTMAVNLVFLAILFAWFPKHVFTALSTRGDWFLDGSTASWANGMRQKLFAAADQLEWLWELTHDNPFDDDQPQPKPSPSASGTGRPQPAPTPRPVASSDPDGKEPPPKGDDGKPAGATARDWPFEPTLHPAVAALPASEETSIQAVGAYLARNERDPRRLVKALHDYAADRIAYDAPNYVAGRYPPQDANTVFTTRVGVCAGYARLLVALGEAAGVEIVYLVGQSRDIGGSVDGQGHAWNAARVEGSWYLIDATWDAGYVEGDKFTKKYTSDYLLTPPEVFGLNHYPEEERWQLRDKPISRGDFMRQPNVRPMLYAKGFKLVDPDRSQVTVDGSEFTLELDNQLGKWLMANWAEKGVTGGQRCAMQHGPRTSGRCSLPGGGTYHVSLFVGDEQYGTYWYAGQFEVNRR